MGDQFENCPEIYNLKPLESHFNEYQTILIRQNMGHKGPNITYSNKCSTKKAWVAVKGGERLPYISGWWSKKLP